MTSTPLEFEELYRASPERLFAAWTDADQLVQWFGMRVEAGATAHIDLKVGGTWRFAAAGDGPDEAWLEGTYREIDPARRLVFTWSHVVKSADGRIDRTPASLVTVTFEAEGTRLRLRHEDIQTKSGREGVTIGWRSSLAALGDVVGRLGGAA